MQGAWVHTLAGEVLHAMWAIQKKEIYRQHTNVQVSLVAQWLRIWQQCRRCGFNPWVRKIPRRRKQQPIPAFLPGESTDRGAWWVTVHGVAKSRTRLSNSHSQHKGEILFIKNRIKLSSYKNIGMWKQKQQQKKTSKNNLQALKEWKQQPWTKILGKIIFTI